MQRNIRRDAVYEVARCNVAFCICKVNETWRVPFDLLNRFLLVRLQSDPDGINQGDFRQYRLLTE
jgi:hypothetical protein